MVTKVVLNGKTHDAAVNQFLAAADKAKTDEQIVLDTPVVSPANIFAAKQLISLNNAKATSRSIAHSPEQWMIISETLYELGRLSSYNAAASAHAKMARRMSTLTYVNDGVVTDNRRSLNFRLSTVVQRILDTGKPLPEVLTLTWDCDPTGEYYASNKMEYQLISKALELYERYSSIDTDTKGDRFAGPAELDDSQFEAREAELSDPALTELREASEGPSTVL